MLAGCGAGTCQVSERGAGLIVLLSIWTGCLQRRPCHLVGSFVTAQGQTLTPTSSKPKTCRALSPLLSVTRNAAVSPLILIADTLSLQRDTH